MANLIGIGVLGKFAQPDDFQQTFYFDVGFNKKLDFRPDSIALFPDTELFCVKREIVNGIHSIAYCIYTYTEEIVTERQGAFIGSCIVLQNGYTTAGNIYRLLKELHTDTLRNPTNVSYNIIRVQNADHLVVREPFDYLAIRTNTIPIDQTPFYSGYLNEDKKYLVYPSDADELIGEQNIIDFFDKATREYRYTETLYLTLDDSVAEHVRQQNRLPVIGWKDFLNNNNIQPPQVARSKKQVKKAAPVAAVPDVVTNPLLEQLAATVAAGKAQATALPPATSEALPPVAPAPAASVAPTPPIAVAPVEAPPASSSAAQPEIVKPAAFLQGFASRLEQANESAIVERVSAPPTVAPIEQPAPPPPVSTPAPLPVAPPVVNSPAPQQSEPPAPSNAFEQNLAERFRQSLESKADEVQPFIKDQAQLNIPSIAIGKPKTEPAAVPAEAKAPVQQAPAAQQAQPVSAPPAQPAPPPPAAVPAAKVVPVPPVAPAPVAPVAKVAPTPAVPTPEAAPVPPVVPAAMPKVTPAPTVPKPKAPPAVVAPPVAAPVVPPPADNLPKLRLAANGEKPVDYNTVHNFFTPGGEAYTTVANDDKSTATDAGGNDINYEDLNLSFNLTRPGSEPKIKEVNASEFFDNEDAAASDDAQGNTGKKAADTADEDIVTARVPFYKRRKPLIIIIAVILLLIIGYFVVSSFFLTSKDDKPVTDTTVKHTEHQTPAKFALDTASKDTSQPQQGAADSAAAAQAAAPKAKGLTPKPNMEVSVIDIINLRRSEQSLKYKLLPDLVRIIFDKFPATVGRIYAGQEEDYGKLLVSENKGCFQKVGDDYMYAHDSMAHIPAYRNNRQPVVAPK